MVDHADAVSGDLYRVIQDLENYYEEGDITGLVLVIDGFEINEELREKGYGSKFLRKIMDDLFYINIELVGLIPGYYGGSNKEYLERNNKIQSFYQRCGFEIVNPGDRTPVMAKYLHLKESI